jgi:hypothetical protein
MKGKILKQIVVLLVFAAAASTLTSCNRGYGCPQFSAADAAVQVVETAVDAVLPN